MIPDHFDKDGRLHLSAVAISRVGVEPYTGAEILRDADKISGGQIDPARRYHLWRSPDVLRRSASTFKNLPLTKRHVPFGLDELKPAIIGTVGNVHFADPHLLADIVVWSGDAIDRIGNGSQAAPSVGYAYTVRMESGVFNGQRFDGRLENITGHHLALVPNGRSGLAITPRASQSYRFAA